MSPSVASCILNQRWRPCPELNFLPLQESEIVLTRQLTFGGHEMLRLLHPTLHPILPLCLSILEKQIAPLPPKTEGLNGFSFVEYLH